MPIPIEKDTRSTSATSTRRLTQRVDCASTDWPPRQLSSPKHRGHKMAQKPPTAIFELEPNLRVIVARDSSGTACFFVFWSAVYFGPVIKRNGCTGHFITIIDKTVFSGPKISKLTPASIFHIPLAQFYAILYIANSLSNRQTYSFCNEKLNTP